MKAVLVRETGGPEVLTCTDVEPPSPGPTDLLVDVAAAGVNFIDTYHRSGAYPRELPFVAGLEGAGIVRAAGADTTGFAPGDRVAWAAAPGSYAEQVVVPAGVAVTVPDAVTMEVAAAAMLQGLTAHYLTTSVYPVAEGDWVLVHAGAGGVGLLLTQLARARGARVIATVSTPEKEKLALAAGATAVIGYGDFPAQVRELTEDAGVAVAYDGVGRATFDGSLASLRIRGTLALFGAASGPVEPVDPQRLNTAGSVYLTRPTLAHFTSDRDELRRRAGELFDAIASGALDVRLGGDYPLAEARQAHTDLEARRTAGKLLLTP